MTRYHLKSEVLNAKHLAGNNCIQAFSDVKLNLVSNYDATEYVLAKSEILVQKNDIL